jgi:hypothetical protein
MNLRCLVIPSALVGRDDDARTARDQLMQLKTGSRGTFSCSFYLDEALARRYERDRQHAWSL